MKHSPKYFLAVTLIAGTFFALRVLAQAAHEGHDHDAKPTTSAPAEHHEDAHADEVKLTESAIKLYGVRTETARKQILTNAVVAPARVTFDSDAMAHVGSPVAGRTSELLVKLGDNVKKGDVLAIIDSPELGESQSDFLLKRTATDTARPAVKLAKDAYDRAKDLYDQSQGIALSEVQKREADLRTAEGTLRAAEASTTAAENKLHLYGMNQDDVSKLAKTGEIVPRYRVLASIAGQIIQREVTLGELVRPDRESIMVIADLSTVWVIADVPEGRLSDVAKESNARVKVTAMKGQTIEGKVTYIAPALDPNTRSAKVRIEVSDPTGSLKPGMFAETILFPPIASQGEAVLAVPEEAVQVVEGGPAVFVPVEGEPNTFAKRAIRIGEPMAGMVQVSDGLKEGESFVVTGSFILKAELGKAGAAHEH